jgi:hypothetical protein
VNLAGLRTQFRSDADDNSTPPLFATADVDGWFNQAVEEAAIRADLLLEVDDAAICAIAVAANVAGYPLHPKVLRVTYATFQATGDAQVCKLTLIDRIELDRIRPNWRECTGGPEFLLTENGKARLVPKPDRAGTLSIECFRLPLVSLAADVDVPEIREQHHRYLVDWALFRAYSKPDTETTDLARANAAQERFEAHFGTRPDADMKQASERLPQFNKPW